MAAVGLLLNPPKFSQSDVSYVSYESCELCKKKTGANGGVRSLHCRGKGFGLRARVVGSSSAVVPSPWRLLHRRWKAKDWRRQGASHQRGNDSGNAIKERQRQCQCGGNQKVRTKQQESPTKQQGWTEQDIYTAGKRQSRRTLASTQERLPGALCLIFKL